MKLCYCVAGAVGAPGQKGDKGLPGLPGANGPVGLPGPIGPQGPKGDRGQMGHPGRDGADGKPGVPGIKGDMGYPGAKGEMGLPGIQGQKGDKGELGYTGAPGIPGLMGQKGDMGLPGLNGAMGAMGMVGEKGFPGPKGRDGRDGLMGMKGQKGEPGMMPPPGPKGEPGYPGRDGMKGDRGLPGPQGLVGLQGERGERGEQGLIGLTGPMGRPGPKGDQGVPGPMGRDGLAGLQGAKGDAGLACTAAQDYLTGILLVKHSQSEEVPSCESGHIHLWSGYSMLYVDGNDFAHSQDLGSPGSCVRRFSTQPVMSCGPNNICNYASRNDKSFWLTTTTRSEMPMEPVPAQKVSSYISRCVVCEAPSNVIALHSQNLGVPNCPYGWESLWVGYSFLMVSLYLILFHLRLKLIASLVLLQYTAAGNGGGGLALQSPGSCLQDFTTTPFIECNGGKGQCHFYETMTSFWLVTIEDREEFQRPAMATLKAGNLLNKVSRCNVCIKNS